MSFTDKKLKNEEMKMAFVQGADWLAWHKEKQFLFKDELLLAEREANEKLEKGYLGERILDNH